MAKRNPARRSVPVSLSLPQARSTPSRELLDYTWLVYGREKIGKTSMFSHAPDTLYLSTEPGHKDLSIYVIDLKSWGDFLKAVAAIEADPKKFRMVVVDTVDNLYDWCMQSVCKSRGIDHPGDEDYGKGWSAVRTDFKKGMLRLAQVVGTVFISHEVIRDLERRSGAKQSVILPSLAKQARGVLEGFVDVIARYHYDDAGKRVLQIYGDEMVTAGCRISHHFTMVEDTGIIQMGKDSEEAWKNFQAAFANLGSGRRKLTGKKVSSKKTTAKKKVAKKTVRTVRR